MVIERDDVHEISCFVIGPIGDKDAADGSSERLTFEEAIQVLEEVIEPACVAFGIRAVRSDRVTRVGEIPEQVFRSLRAAHLVIADLTGANPNVMYELGLRHTTGKLTIQIGERGRLPFDIASIRTILFRRTENGLVEARRQLTAAIAEGLARGGDPVAATRVWFETIRTDLATTAAIEDAQDEDEEPGFLEKLAATSEGLDSLNLNLDAMTAVMREINVLADDTTKQMQAVNASGANAGARLFLANTHAQKLDQPAGRLEVLVGDYRQSVERMHPGMIYALGEAKKHADAHDAETASAEAFREQVRQFIAATDETWPVLASFRQILFQTGEAARSLRRVNRRIAAALLQQTTTAAYFDQWRELL